MLPNFQRGIIVQKAKNYRFLSKIIVLKNYYAFFPAFFANLTKLTWQKMVYPVQVIVFQKLRSFFTFSGSKLLSYSYRINVGLHFATLVSCSAGTPCSLDQPIRPCLIFITKNLKLCSFYSDIISISGGFTTVSLQMVHRYRAYL